MSYQYWIIRFVPDVARGEFSNIGIVCGRDGGDWAVAFDLGSIRNRGGFSSDLREMNSWVSWFKSAVEDAGASQDACLISSAWIEHLRSRQANSIQFSEPSPVQVQEAEEGVSLLFPRLVERASNRKSPRLSRGKLRVEVRKAFAHDAGFTPGEDLFTLPRLQVGKQRGRFDIVRFRGASEALTNVWSFNVADLDALERDIFSWNYLVARLRDGGAELTVSSSRRDSISLPAESPIDVVYDPPSTESGGRRSNIFEAAIEAWDLGDVTARTLTEFRSEVLVGEVAGA